MGRYLMLAVAGLGFIAAAGAAVDGTAADAAESRSNRPTTSIEQDPGEVVYRSKGNCAACHGLDGSGTPLGPDLTDGVWLHGSGSLAEVIDLVRVGVTRPKQYPAPMPPMGGARLNPAEIEAVARYVLALNRDSIS